MNILLKALDPLPAFQTLRSTALSGGTAAVSGAGQIARAHLIAALSHAVDRPAVVVCQDDTAARRLQSELAAFLEVTVPVLPTRELTFFDVSAVSRGWEQQRLRQLAALAAGKTPLLIASLEALCLRTMPPAMLQDITAVLHPGDSMPLTELTVRLERAGYVRCSLVEGPGQYALRGGILDVFSPAHDFPLRMEFFGDDLDAMGFFDPMTQRRTENAEEAVLLPMAETQPGLHPDGLEGLCRDIGALAARLKRRKHRNEALLLTLERDRELLENNAALPAADRYLSLIYPQGNTAASYIPDNAVVMFCDHGSLVRAAKQRQDTMNMELEGMLEAGLIAGELCNFSVNYEDLFDLLPGRAVLYLDNFLASSYPVARPPHKLLSVSAKQLPPYGASLQTAVQDLTYYQKSGYGVLVLTGNKRRGEILQELLRDNNLSSFLSYSDPCLPRKDQLLLTGGSLPAGVEYPELQLAILTEGQIVPRPETRKRAAPKQATNRQKLKAFTDLCPGDLVVHDYHGIGRYAGIEPIKSDGVIKDYIKINYHGSDVLYIPVTQLDQISKYIGGGEDAPVRLNKLGGDQWKKSKARAKKAVQNLAAGLIQLYAERQRLPGYAFPADPPWQTEFEDSFEYTETDDQLRCVAEIKRDMETPRPMDRLLCGDVGFGKTEVALRAAMKCMLDGKQCAILVPTTVLARQHYVTAMKRFAGFPVKVEVLSRFRTAAQLKDTLRRMAEGGVDLVIGTHKLLQKNVVFHDLGLLIVDEEQRFGVTHKERLKELSRGVDVLTLSATPIPRTLNMALSGIRDMSTIEEPPQNRYPVQTFVLEYNDAVVFDAIRRELERGGQVYYLHNRVETIDRAAARIKERFPDVSVAVAHGKMNEETLSDVMQRMDEGEIQILVCTTIIETGVDIPSVNTLIVEDADRFGLSQLHQLRGRVGRSNRHAFCYLTFRPGKVLTEVADKRLSAIRDFAEFGSGFKIAMRDLEIRGAGDLLGAEQSGHMLSVGYDMYLKLLEDAVLEARGEERVKEPECVCDITVQANIDKNYVAAPEQRMDLYRRMAAIRSEEDAEDLLDELLDRFGEPPAPVRNLIDVALLRAASAAAGIQSVKQNGSDLHFTLADFDFSLISAICAEPSFQGKVFFSAGKVPALRRVLGRKEPPLQAAREFVDAYAALKSAPPAPPL